MFNTTQQPSRRRFVKNVAITLGTAAAGTAAAGRAKQVFGAQPTNVKVVDPRGRIPLSFVIDDSTCLVNLAYYAMPQFAQAWPARKSYKKPWETWPREIPDSFVRAFGQWCVEHDVKGKYSVVPYPARVGWLDRELPGWSRRQLESSLELVRTLMVPNWDIHPEMLTHTRVIDLKTGRPLEPVNSSTMENSYPQTDISVDQLASYLAASLRILKNCGLPCEGITTPGGFGNRVKNKLPLAVHQAVRDIYQAELPHYFKYIAMGEESVEPRLEFTDRSQSVSNLTVNVPAGTGDWFGGWDGDRRSEGFRYASSDATMGRMVQLIERGDPAIMLCHWPGLYCQGARTGFHDFQRVVIALKQRFGEQTRWMKLSEIGRYWVARKLTQIDAVDDQTIAIEAPIDCTDFTIQCTAPTEGPPTITSMSGDNSSASTVLKRVANRAALREGTYCTDDGKTLLCFSLKAGMSQVKWDR